MNQADYLVESRLVEMALLSVLYSCNCSDERTNVVLEILEDAFISGMRNKECYKLREV